MLRAVAGNTARQDFPTLRYETTESGNILIVNVLDFIDTESANLLTGLPVPVTSDQSNPSSIKKVSLRQEWMDRKNLRRPQTAEAREPMRQILPAGMNRLPPQNSWNPGTPRHPPQPQ